MLSIQRFKYSLLPCFTLVGVKMPQVYSDIAVVMHTELFTMGPFTASFTYKLHSFYNDTRSS